MSALSRLISNIWTEEDKTKPKDLVRSESEVKKTKIVKDAEDPAVVFFPTNADSDCMDGNTGWSSSSLFNILYEASLGYKDI